MNKENKCWLNEEPFRQCCCKCEFQREEGKCYVFVNAAEPSEEFMEANIQSIENHSVGCELYKMKGVRKIRISKFRGKCFDNKWVYGSHQHVLRKVRCELIIDWDTNREYHVIPETIGQFVGWKDSEGNEVYEDDLYIDIDQNIYVVVYDQKKCCFILDLISGNDSACFEIELTKLNLSAFKVVGTLHDIKKVEKRKE